MSKFKDWCGKAEVICTGKGWAVRINGCDVFDPINEHGVKRLRSFDVVQGLASQQEAEAYLSNWLRAQQSAAVDAITRQAITEEVKHAYHERKTITEAVEAICAALAGGAQ